MKVEIHNIPMTGFSKNKRRDIKYTIDSNDCWDCVSHTKNDRGYPVIGITQNYKHYTVYIAKFLYERKHNLQVNSLNNLEVCHNCDNHSCINPDHVFIGTHSNNMIDWSHRRDRKEFKLTKMLNGNKIIVGKYIQAFFDLDTYKLIRNEALMEGKSLNDFIFSVIKNYLNRKEDSQKNCCTELRRGSEL